MNSLDRHDTGGRYARDEAKHAFFTGIVERCADAMVEAVGESNIAALFMTGAPSRGEATVVETSAGLYGLSDVDLVCVTLPGTDAAAARAAARRAVAELNRELADICVGVDATIKPQEHAGHLPPLISNYEFVRSPALLRGRPATREILGQVDIEQIPPDDALRFVHNRCIEQLLGGGSAASGTGAATTGGSGTRADPEAEKRAELETLRAYYSTAKLMLDLVTAFLFVRRHVPLGYEERVTLFTEDYCGRAEFRALAGDLEPFLAELPLWVGFKTTGDARALRASLPDAVLTGAHAAPYARAMWKGILGDVLGEDLSMASLPEAIDRLRAAEGPTRSFARSLKTLLSGSGRSLFPAGAVVRGALHASPAARAYITGLLLFFSGLGGADTGGITDRAEPGRSAGSTGGSTPGASREWTRAALARYAPFSLPAGFRSMADMEMRRVLLSRLARFHNEVLLGRDPIRGEVAIDGASTGMKAD